MAKNPILPVHDCIVTWDACLGDPVVTPIVGNSSWVTWATGLRVMVVGDTVPVIEFPEGKTGWVEVTRKKDAELIAAGSNRQLWHFSTGRNRRVNLRLRQSGMVF